MIETEALAAPCGGNEAPLRELLEDTINRCDNEASRFREARKTPGKAGE